MPLLLALLLAVAATPPNQLTPAEQAAGWRLLFDGKTTHGWRGYRAPAAPPGWQVVEGALTRVDRAGDLLTVDEFQDFELVFDWRIAEGGNSGVMYRVEESQEQPYLTGPEYQVLDDARHPDATRGRDGNRKSGALYDSYPPARNVARPAGAWNQARIVVNGPRIEHWLNGTRVVTAALDSPDWRKRIAASKWATAPRFARSRRGHIDLQDHGDQVAYRNIKLRPLAPASRPAARSSPG